MDSKHKWIEKEKKKVPNFTKDVFIESKTKNKPQPFKK